MNLQPGGAQPPGPGGGGREVTAAPISSSRNCAPKSSVNCGKRSSCERTASAREPVRYENSLAGAILRLQSRSRRLVELSLWSKAAQSPKPKASCRLRKLLRPVHESCPPTEPPT